MSKIEIGSRVVAGAGNDKKGVVMFMGQTKFASGDWVGIRLDVAEGKNDGSVGGDRYFECEANHGLFVKLAQVRLDRDSMPQNLDPQQKLAALRERRKKREEMEKTVVKSTTEESIINTTPQRNSSSTPPSSASNEDIASSLSLEQPILEERLKTDSDTTTAATLMSSNMIRVEESHLTIESQTINLVNSSNQTTDSSIDKLSSTTTINLPSIDITSTTNNNNSIPAADMTIINNSDNLKYQIDLLKSQLSEETVRSTQYQNQVEQLSTQVQVLTQNMNEYKKQNDTLQLTLKNQQKEITIKEQQNQEMSNQLKKVQNLHMDTTQNRIIQLEKLLEEKENQMQELTDTIEILTLDKEQLMIDKELQDELLQSLQQSGSSSTLSNPQLMETPHKGMNDSTMNTSSNTGNTPGMKSSSAISQQLSEENSKLREALKRLKEVTTMEIQALKSNTTDYEKRIHMYEIMEMEYTHMKEDYQHCKEECIELRTIVDTSASYESMIENLSDQNLVLTQKYQELQVLHQDMLYEQELMEELDQTQRQEIKTLKSKVDNTQSLLITYENEIKMLQERVDEMKKIEDKYKRLIDNQKQESSQLQNKLGEMIELTETHQKQVKSVTDVKLSQLTLITNLKNTLNENRILKQEVYEHHIKYIRYESIFGSMNILSSEKSWMNMEYNIISLAYTGSQLCQSMLSKYIHGYSISTSTSTSITTTSPFSSSILSTMTHIFKTTCFLWNIVSCILFDSSLSDETFFDSYIGYIMNSTLSALYMKLQQYMYEVEYSTETNTGAANTNTNTQVLEGISNELSVLHNEYESRWNKLISSHTNTAMNIPKFDFDIGNTVSTSALTDQYTGSILHVLLQLYTYLHSIKSVFSWIHNWATYHHEPEYNELIQSIQMYIDITYASISTYQHYKNISVQLLVWKQNMITIRNIFQRIYVMTQGYIHKKENHHMIEQKGHLDSSFLRQIQTLLKEVNIICKDSYDQSGTIKPSEIQYVDKEGKYGVIDMILYPVQVWEHLTTYKSSGGSSTSDTATVTKYNKTGNTGSNSSGSSTSTSYSILYEQLLSIQPIWYKRCTSIKQYIVQLELSHTQIQDIIKQKVALQTELDMKKDELKAAINRCTELHTIITQHNITSSKSLIDTAMATSSSLMMSNTGVDDKSGTNNTLANSLQEEIKMLTEALSLVEKRCDTLEKENKFLKSITKTNTLGNTSNTSGSGISASMSMKTVSSGVTLSNLDKTNANNNINITSINLSQIMHTIMQTQPKKSKKDVALNTQYESLFSSTSTSNNILISTSSSTSSSSVTSSNTGLLAEVVEAIQYQYTQKRAYRKMAMKKVLFSLSPLHSPYDTCTPSTAETTTTTITKENDLHVSFGHMDKKEDEGHHSSMRPSRDDLKEKYDKTFQVYKDIRNIIASVRVYDVTTRQLPGYSCMDISSIRTGTSAISNVPHSAITPTPTPTHAHSQTTHTMTRTKGLKKLNIVKQYDTYTQYHKFLLSQ